MVLLALTLGNNLQCQVDYGMRICVLMCMKDVWQDWRRTLKDVPI